MEQLINTVLEADAKAKAILEKALNIKAECEKRAEDEEKISKNVMKKAEESAAEYKAQKEKELELRRAELRESTDRKLSALDEKYNENKAEWVDKMFRDITESL